MSASRSLLVRRQSSASRTSPVERPVLRRDAREDLLGAIEVPAPVYGASR
ncbi:hypothetical protein WMF38_33760 [Sorangium sp. So ce118]